MLTGILVVLGLALLILGHEAGHFFAAKAFGMKVEEFGFGFPPRILYKKTKETIYSLNLLPLGGFVRIAGENERLLGDTETLESYPPAERKKLFFVQAPWRRSIVILAGIAINILLGWLLFSGVLWVGSSNNLIVMGVQEDSPAAQAGILPKDRILNFKTDAEFIKFGKENGGRVVRIEIEREGEPKTFELMPRINPGPGQGATGIILAGITPRPLGVALKDGAIMVWESIAQTFEGLGLIFNNLMQYGRLPAGIMGPVGIFSVAQESARVSVIFFVHLLALISVNLAVLNVLPIPALDGGRFLLILIEKAKGSPVSRKTEIGINTAGLALLLLLMLAVTVRDVIQL
ncbi:MAG: M50 family metallopeptidase [Candidatus Liptonbacteria bacterium]